MGALSNAWEAVSNSTSALVMVSSAKKKTDHCDSSSYLKHSCSRFNSNRSVHSACPLDDVFVCATLCVKWPKQKVGMLEFVSVAQSFGRSVWVDRSVVRSIDR